MKAFIQKYAKAIIAFFVTYLGTVVAMSQSGATLDDIKTYLLALATAIVTTYGVYQVPNKETK